MKLLLSGSPFCPVTFFTFAFFILAFKDNITIFRHS